MTYFREAVMAAITLIAVAIALLTPGAMLAPQALTFGIILITLGFWATGLVPGYLASLFLFAGLLLPGLASPDVVFSGFTSSAMWLIIAGFVIGAAITNTGLGARIGEVARPHLSKSYPMLIGGLMVIGMVLGFVMPSSLGRSAVLVPVGMALADMLGLEKGSKGRTGVAVVIAIGTNMPSFAILPSNIPNIILSGLADKAFGVEFSYADYLLLHYPVLGLLKSAFIVGLVLIFFPARVAPTPAKITDDSPTSSRKQGLLMVVLLATIGFWATDQLHGINAAWIGLTASLVLLIPRLGLVPPPVFKGAVDFGMLLFVAGALALGAVVNASGLGTLIAHQVIAVLPLSDGNDFLNFFSLSSLGIVTSIFTTMPGVPAVLTPLAGELSQVTGFSLEAVLMTQVLGFSTVLFPYQIGPLIVAMGLAGESPKHLVKMTLAITALSFVIFIPLDFLWWQVLGWI
ncbi:SLC13 family permease [Celeribacter neptunius]|uniref:Di-and tricarboxylate transporter n=1 Tax=Celeribacter neptunius TaxID=588602 RepID=A0A1I3PBU2_9RHOB|nr:SLC13 family permease [Celeribacter neptunius]SFJ18516.1 Di-and tricarboxylate transporter [Celeribacter neptunius]